MSEYELLSQGFNELLNFAGRIVQVKNTTNVTKDSHDDATITYSTSSATGLFVTERLSIFKEAMGPLEEGKSMFAMDGGTYIGNDDLIVDTEGDTQIEYKVSNIRRPQIEGNHVYVLCDVEELNRTKTPLYTPADIVDTISKTSPLTSPWTQDLTDYITEYALTSSGNATFQLYNEDGLQFEKGVNNTTEYMQVYYDKKHRVMVATDSDTDIDITISISGREWK